MAKHKFTIEPGAEANPGDLIAIPGFDVYKDSWWLEVVRSIYKTGRVRATRAVSFSENTPNTIRSTIPKGSLVLPACHLKSPPEKIFRVIGRDRFDSLDDLRNALRPFVKQSYLKQRGWKK